MTKKTTTAVRLWIRETQRCVCCGAPYPDPHHVRPKGLGGVADEDAIDVENVAALCRRCHRRGHTRGWQTFQREERLDLHREAVRTWRRWLVSPSRAWFESRVREGVLA